MEIAKCPNCGAPVKPDTAQCEYCDTWFKVEEPKSANATQVIANHADTRILSIYPYTDRSISIGDNCTIRNSTICSTHDAMMEAENQRIAMIEIERIRRAEQLQQEICCTIGAIAEERQRRAEQCSNAIPYNPAPEPLCDKTKRKSFKRNKEGFFLLTLLTIVNVAMLALCVYSVFVNNAIMFVLSSMLAAVLSSMLCICLKRGAYE